MAVQPGPKGTRDFYPELMSFQEYLFDSWKQTCRRYSFEAAIVNLTAPQLW